MQHMNKMTVDMQKEMVGRALKYYNMIPDLFKRHALGPMKVMPSSAQRRAKVAFSDRKPYPGWMASTSASLAICGGR